MTAHTEKRALPKKPPFCGLSVMPDAPEAERLSVCENLFRDYAAGAGGALSMIPGFRAVATLDGAIHGIYAHGGALLVHAGTKLYAVTGEDDVTMLTGSAADAPSRGFTFAGDFYLLDGVSFQRLSGNELTPVTADAPLVAVNGQTRAAPSLLTRQTRCVFDVEEGETAGETPASLVVGSPAAYVGRDTFVEAPPSAGRVDLGVYRDTPVTFLSVNGGEVIDNGGVGNLPDALLLRAGTDDLTLASSMNALTRRTTLYLDAEGNNRISLAAVPHYVRTSPPDVHISCPVSGLSGIFDRPLDLRFLPPNFSIAPGETFHTGILTHLTGRVAAQYAASVLPTADTPPVVEVRAVPGNTTGRIGLYEQDGEIVLKTDAGFSATGDAGIVYAACLETQPGVFRDFFFNIAIAPTPVETAVYHFGSLCRPRLFPAAGTPIGATAADDPVPFGTVTDGAGKPLYAAVGAGRSGSVCLTFESEEKPLLFAGEKTAFGAPGVEMGALSTRRALIDGCRFFAVLDGRLILGGNPRAPRLLLYGEPDVADFGLCSYFSVPHDVNDLFAADDALYVLTDGGVYRYRKQAGTGFVPAAFVSVGHTAVRPVGPCLSFGGEVLLPAEGGVFGFRPTAADPLETLYPRSDAIPATGPVEGAVTFEGYAALFCRGKVFLADGRTARPGGTGRWQYDWYPLVDVGVRYQKTGAVTFRTGRYHTLPEPPSSMIGKDVTAAGHSVTFDGWRPVDAACVLTGALSLNGDPAGTALYALIDDRCYLCDGPLEYDDAGDFYPAIHPFVLSAAAGSATSFFATGTPELLFFGDELGHLYLVSTDKREGGALAPCWYHFDGHRIRARLLTGRDDGDRPFERKNMRPGTLTLLSRNMGGAPPRLDVLTDCGGDFRIKAGDGGFAFDDLGFLAPGFDGGDVRRQVFPLAPRRYVTLRFALSDGGFCAPFGVYSIHYGYTVAGRMKR